MLKIFPIKSALLVILLSFTIPSCGRVGALYLPKEETQKDGAKTENGLPKPLREIKIGIVK